MRWRILGLAMGLALLTACAGPSRGTYLGELAVIRTADGEFVCAPTGNEPTRFDQPEEVIDPDKNYLAIITMADGQEIVIALFTQDAPITVNSFVFLACQGFFDDITFHRVIPGFVAQSGDPSASGRGDAGYTLADEYLNGHVFDRPGMVAMANIGRPQSAGSQFFITYNPILELNGAYTIFGEVVEGMAVVDALTPRDPDTALQPGDVIRSIRIMEIP